MYIVDILLFSNPVYKNIYCRMSKFDFFLIVVFKY